MSARSTRGIAEGHIGNIAAALYDLDAAEAGTVVAIEQLEAVAGAQGVGDPVAVEVDQADQRVGQADRRRGTDGDVARRVEAAVAGQRPVPGAVWRG